MIVEKLPIIREWEFYTNDDLVITFSMKDNGEVISLAGCTASSIIRDEDNSSGVLVSTGICEIVNDVITVTHDKEAIALRVEDMLYGDIRIVTEEAITITLLRFSGIVKASL